MVRSICAIMLCGFLICGAASRADDDPVRKKLDAAKAAYDKAIKDSTEEVGKWFEKEDGDARKLKSGVTEKVKQVAAERKEFEDKGTLPKRAPLALRDRPSKAADALVKAYKAASDEYSRQKKDDEAAAVEKELEEFKSGGAVVAAAEKWVPLFNGKDLAGWKQTGGTATRFTVDNGVLVGRNDGSGVGGALVYAQSEVKPLKDFALRVKGYAPKNGAYVMFRGVTVAEGGKGFNVPLFYSSEGKGGVGDLRSFDPGRGSAVVAAARKVEAKAGEDFDIVIRCRGTRISVSVNGRQVAEYDDKQNFSPAGFISLVCSKGAELRVNRMELAVFGPNK
jgi:hypothetical protein